MAAYISRKTSWFRCLASFLPAAGLAVLLCVLLEGPRLGHIYDFLLRQRPAPPVSRELLIIDSSMSGQELGDDILEPGAASSLLYTLTELGARTLIIQVPILGLSAGGNAGEAEILYRFDEEFSLLSRNIRNLFDAIRTGSVAPAESARYVGELVELSDKGKERLVAALVRRDEEGIEGMERAAAFFGHVRRPGDLRVQLISTGEGGRPGVLMERDEYSRARPDRDGVLRRIMPVMTIPELSDGNAGERTMEHIVYGALKTRFSNPKIEYTTGRKPDSSNLQFVDLQSVDLQSAGTKLFSLKPLPVLTVRDSANDTDTIIPLDHTGAVLFEVPHGGEDFRRIGILDFLAYDEADRTLRRMLLEGETLGIYQYIDGENYPGFLYDYALAFREELASSYGGGDEEKKLTWIEARNRYFISLENFLYGPSEMNLVGGYEEIIALESLEEAEVIKMTGMRDSLIRTFIALREKHGEVLELRNKLEAALAGSFCILGKGSAGENHRLPVRPAGPNQAPAGTAGASRNPQSFFSLLLNFPQSISRSIRSAFYWTNPTDAESSALLANSILTGRVVKPGRDLYLLLVSLLWSLLICFLIKSLGPVPALGIGAFLTLLIGAAFSLSFIFSGLWLNPLVPVASGAAAVLVSFTWGLIARGRYNRRFRIAFGPFVSRSCLRSVIRMGKPLPGQTVTARAAVAAVKKTDTGPSDAGAQTVLIFQKKVSELFRKAGGTIIGTDGDMVITCFGSPLERVFLGGKRKVSPYEDNIYALAAPAMRAVDFISEIAQRPECESWQFGLDLGNCSFAWTALSGYFALGNPVQKARILSRLAGRYKARIVISTAVNDALPDLAAKKLDVLKGKDGGVEEPFYRLAVRSN